MIKEIPKDNLDDLFSSKEDKDLNEVNKLLKELNYELDNEAFKNTFLKVLIYKEDIIKGVLLYQDLYDILTVDYIVVLEDSRKKGIATKLLKSMENKHKNAVNTTLEVRKSNNNAINFYKKNGFKEAAIRKNYYKDEDAILMIKEYR